MTVRRSRKDLENLIRHLNKAYGRPEVAWSMNKLGHRVANEGHLFMDTWSPGDGATRYRLMQITSKGGGESAVGTNRSFSLREFDAFIAGFFACRELERAGGEG